MINRRLNGDYKCPLVIDLSVNHMLVGLAGTEIPLKTFSPKGNIREDSITQLYRYAFNEDWGVNIKNRPIFLVEPTNIYYKERKEFAEFLFNQYSIPLIAFHDKALSFCFSTGRHTVFIVDITEKDIITTPFKGIWRISDASNVIEGAGGPNSDYITIANAIYDSIMKCPKDTQIDFIHNIFLCGEYAEKLNLSRKISEELNSRTTGDLNKYINVIKMEENPFCGWIGGSMTAPMKSFNKWLNKNEYFEGKYYKKFQKIINGEICFDFLYDCKL